MLRARAAEAFRAQKAGSVLLCRILALKLSPAWLLTSLSVIPSGELLENAVNYLSSNGHPGSASEQRNPVYVQDLLLALPAKFFLCEPHGVYSINTNAYLWQPFF